VRVNGFDVVEQPLEARIGVPVDASIVVTRRIGPIIGELD